MTVTPSSYNTKLPSAIPLRFHSKLFPSVRGYVRRSRSFPHGFTGQLEDLETDETESQLTLGFDGFPAGFDCSLENFEGFSESRLCVPGDPLDELEWFPSFTDDSISLNGFLPVPEPKNIFPTTPEQKIEENNRFSSRDDVGLLRNTIPSKKARSKRVCRRVWAQNVLPFSVPESRVPAKCKHEKYYATRRNCTHCRTEKTPQWRMGPKGPKTLCNACGVRYKSGRLLPEYRPAASPSFNNMMYSNSHKKIMKMRRMRKR
ncbi:PREDICTED: GATA transcription factor 7-like [Nelumbo nucifera]|uniref:GATA-type domain-containing protein n=2 Tax=Nelumbo nucifera TaxID=4432 RepID=A0A822XWL7_NELNU|nr:PREDICTED: GATA transcription factor 7-like [Nelumbo nucifera]DAD24720.1 TPA_asm: hypothetical protein HUJ06_026184 [Nelumbo nucifera]